MRNPSSFINSIPTVHLFILGYLIIIALGWLVLSIPYFQNEGTSAINHLFIATSAVSTTGLSTNDISTTYTRFGQIFLLLLIQIGGIGYMTLGSIIILARGKNIEGISAAIIEQDFSLPKRYNLRSFLLGVIIFTVIVECVTTILLWLAFRSANIPEPLWHAVFHSISAFCTAGFSTFSGGLGDFSNNSAVSFIVIGASYLGAIGFIVMVDVWLRTIRVTDTITFTSKIILRFTLIISVGITLLLFLSEPLFSGLSSDFALLAAFFQTASALTTVGFNTIDISSFSTVGLFLLSVVMIVGASPSGTGGGLKSTTISALFALMVSTLRGERHITFWKRTIPLKRLRAAIATFSFYILMLVIGVYLLLLTETGLFEVIMFEAVSALGTVGLSTGLTSDLSNLGKLIVITLMFAGRVGVLTFGSAFMRHSDSEELTDNDIAV